MDKSTAETYLLYSIFVAGKSADFAENVTIRFGQGKREEESPFGQIRRLIREGILHEYLRMCRTGNYRRIDKCFRELVEADLDVTKCTVADLEAIHGIGPKTARFFVMWTRDDQNYAALDVHILRWMRYLGYDAPKSTPTGDKYLELQKAFLDEAKKRGMKARELDFKIWEFCNQGGHKTGDWPEELQKDYEIETDEEYQDRMRGQETDFQSVKNLGLTDH